jgi:RNase H-fold protein (predicted Holliday junction resolvase)
VKGTKESMMKTMKQIAVELVDERLTVGASLEELAGSWTNYAADEEYAGEQMGQALSWDDRTALARACQDEAAARLGD